MPAEVTGGVVFLDPDLVALDRDRDGLLHLADKRVGRLDAAVEDADADAGARRSTPRPLARDLTGPRLGQGDALDPFGRKAPCG